MEAELGGQEEDYGEAAPAGCNGGAANSGCGGGDGSYNEEEETAVQPADYDSGDNNDKNDCDYNAEGGSCGGGEAAGSSSGGGYYGGGGYGGSGEGGAITPPPGFP